MSQRRLDTFLIGCVGFLAVAAILLGFGFSDWVASRSGLFMVLAGVALAVALIAFASLFRAARRAEAALTRLRGTAAALASAVVDPNDLRAAAILEALSEPVLVINQLAQVTLVNGPAKALLGAEQVAVGTSVYAALARRPLERALARGETTTARLDRTDGESLQASIVPLAGGEGAVLCFGSRREAGSGGLDHDLSLHDQPPRPRPIDDATPLDDLPVVVLDCETTGLDVTADRVVSLGAVRLQGGRIFRTTCLDLLVNPGCGIPAGSTAIHGITDAMVADAPAFAPVFDRFNAMSEGCLLIGHNMPFDVTMLAREAEIEGLSWTRPPVLDTLRLSSAMYYFHDLDDFSLESLAGQLGVTIRGRHTALGDALVTAEIYARMLPLLAAEGVTTLGQARHLSSLAQGVIRNQKAAGWLDC